jgi:hypothetical protein
MFIPPCNMRPNLFVNITILIEITARFDSSVAPDHKMVADVGPAALVDMPRPDRVGVNIHVRAGVGTMDDDFINFSGCRLTLHRVCPSLLV